MGAGDGLCILTWQVMKTMNCSVRDQHVGFQIENSSKFAVLATGLVLAKRIFPQLDELPANEYQASRHAELIWIEGGAISQSMQAIIAGAVAEALAELALHGLPADFRARAAAHCEEMRALETRCANRSDMIVTELHPE